MQKIKREVLFWWHAIKIIVLISYQVGVAHTGRFKRSQIHLTLRTEAQKCYIWENRI